MVKKYTRILIQREININTGSTWALQDVPNTWRARTKAAVEAEGYTWDENGCAIKVEEERPVEGE